MYNEKIIIDSGDKRKRPTINKLVADRGDYVTLAKTTKFGAIINNNNTSK